MSIGNCAWACFVDRLMVPWCGYVSASAFPNRADERMSDATTTGGASTLTITLRGGDSLALWPDRLSIAGTSYPLAHTGWPAFVPHPPGVRLPLLLGLATRESSPYASRQAKQAFFFHLGFAVLTFVAFVVGYAFFFATVFGTAGALDPNTTGPSPAVFASFSGFIVLWGVVGAASLVNIIFSIIGVVRAFQCKDFHYPLLGGL